MMPTALLTNDDGVNSGFFRVLVNAFSKYFEVIMAVPAEEQSWGGRSFSRYKPVTATPLTGFPARGWKLHGTPTDCINIALGNLLPTLPDVVVSGINVGYNTTLPLLYCSGTVSGALEGSLWGVHGIAASQMLTDPLFEVLKESPGEIPESLRPHLEYAADFTAKYALGLLGTPPIRYQVHNINFPTNTNPSTAVAQTVPADLVLNSLFHPTPGESSIDQETRPFSFQFNHGNSAKASALTDRDALQQGKISISKLDFSRLGI